MKCAECNANTLEEFLDGELDARRAAEIGAHLAACRACAARYDALLDEQAVYASYERDLDATPQALWTGVAARIAAAAPPPSPRDERQGQREHSPAGANLPRRVRAWLASALVAPRFSPALTAALMLLAIGTTATVMRYLNSQPAETGLPRDLVVARQPAVTETPSHAARQTMPEATPGTMPGTTPEVTPRMMQEATPEATQGTKPTVAQNGEPSGGANVRRGEPGRIVPTEAQRRRDSRGGADAPANDPAQIAAANQNNEINRRQRATERLVREAEAKYLAAIQMLSEDVNRKRTRLDPQVAARFDETLATIDRSIAETRRTVLRQRNDPVAVQYMLSAYAKKVEVMREMAALD